MSRDSRKINKQRARSDRYQNLVVAKSGGRRREEKGGFLLAEGCRILWMDMLGVMEWRLEKGINESLK